MKRTLSALLALLMLMSLMACSASPNATTPDTTTPPVEEPADTTTTDVTEPDPEVTEEPDAEAPAEDTVPVEEPAVAGPLFDEPTTFSMWIGRSVLMDQGALSFNDTPAWQEVQERTNVTIDWEMVSELAATEQFNLMMVSESYTELIHQGNFATNGYQYYLDEDILVNLAPYFEDGFAPNYQAIRDEDEDVRRDTMLDSGDIATFYRILTTVQQTWKGLVASVVPAEAAGFQVDDLRTLDDLHDLLVAYKSAGVPIPYHMSPDGYDAPLLSAFGLGGGGWTSQFITVDDKIEYGFISDEFYEYLKLTNSWYNEGLIEPEFFGQVSDVVWDLSVLGDGDIGVTFAAATVVQLFSDIAGTEYRAILSPVRNEGDIRNVAQIAACTARTESAATAVTTACHDIEGAIKFLDYFYSDDMFLLANYGIEDVTYTLDENGDPQYTDLFLNDAENNWTSKSNYYALWGTVGYLYAWDAQKIGMADAVLYAYDLWNQNYVDERTLPTLSMTAEEVEACNSRYVDIATYVAESVVKFISGMEPLTEESYAAYVSNIEDMGIDECVEIYQAAYDRYMQR